MTDSSADRDPLDRLAEEFVARFRRGERPALTEYATRLPSRADEVRELFPALVEMEQLKPVTADQTGSFLPAAGPTDPLRVGEFRILRRVGVGGMGVVYEAVQESLGRHVALKLLPIDALADPKRLERFRREAKAAAKLHHTNVVPVFGTGEADGRHFYAMQFIAGHPLDAVIDEVRRLKDHTAAHNGRPVSEVAAALVTGTFHAAAPSSDPAGPAPAAASPALSGSLSDGGRHYWATVAHVGAQVADALAYAHAQGVLHRDIKPANLLLDLRGTVWVTDFGLAKATETDDLTQQGDFIGTIRYMAPERFDGAGDGRADTYALGLTLYEMLTLTPAFVADNRAKLVELVVAASPKPPRAVNPAIPRDLETIVLKAIQRDPAMRYRTAAELAEDLRRFTEDRPILARRASPAEQAWRWCRRNPAVASLVAAVLLVSVTGAVVSGLIAREQQKTAAALVGTLGDLDQTVKVVEKREREAVDRQKELERQQEQTRRDLYAFRINQAHSALVAGRPYRTADLLRDTAPKPGETDFRGWEWHYLNRLLQPDRVIRFAGEDDDKLVRSRVGSAFSLDGSRVAHVYAAADNSGYYCTVSDAATGREIGRLPRTGVLSTGKEPLDRRSAPTIVLSPDGRHALVGQFVVRPRDGREGVGRLGPPRTADPALWKLMDVGTGEATPLPAEFVQRITPITPRNSTLALGPGAAWLTVMDWKATTAQPDDDGGFPDPTEVDGSAEIACFRWDRATGKTATVPAFTIGKGIGTPRLSPDGRHVYWAPAPRPPFGVRSQQADDGQWFECWDVSGAAARQLGKRFPVESGVTGLLASRRFRTALTFSPDGSKVAYLNLANQAVVHRVADGSLLDRITIPGLPRTSSGPFASVTNLTMPFRVNDDATRLVLRLPTAIVVVHKTDTGVVNSWQRPVPEPPPTSPSDTVFSADSLLLNGGNTFVELSVSRGVLRSWDVSRDPAAYRGSPARAETAGRDGKFYERIGSPDGRISLEWQVDDLPGETAFAFGRVLPYTSGPITVRDAGGKVLGTLPEPVENSQVVPAALLGDGNRLLVRFQIASGGSPLFNQSAWKEYELGPAIRVLKTGNTAVTMQQMAGGQYLVEQKLASPAGGPGGRRSDLPIAEFVVVRDGRTGDERHRFELPDRHVRFDGTDPSGRWYLYESVDRAANPFLRPQPPPWGTVSSPRELRFAASALTGPVVQVLPRRWRSALFPPTTRDPGDPHPARMALSAVGGSVTNELPSSFLTRFMSEARFGFPRREKVWPVRLHLVDTATGREKTWDFGPEPFGGMVSRAQFSPDGRRILFRYDRLTEPEKKTPAWRSPVEDHLWVARLDGTVERDLVLKEFPSAPVSGRGFGSGQGLGTSVVGSPDNRTVAVAGTEVVEIWDLETGTLRHTLPGHTGSTRDTIAMMYNADGSRLFTVDGVARNGPSVAFAGKPQVHVWDTVSGRELLSLDMGDAGPIASLNALRASFADGKLTLRAALGQERVLDGTPVAP